jgi:hypothetical protein
LPEVGPNDAEQRALASTGDAKFDAEQRGLTSAGDAKFLAEVKRRAPDLAMLADRTVAAIRAAGIEGELVENQSPKQKGRWINR